MQAIKEGWPEFNDETWYMMAMTIAAQNPQVFPKVYALCNQKLGTNPAGPAEHAATYIRSPLQQAPWSAPPYNNTGNPPPPPPRPSPAPRLADGGPPPLPSGPPPPRYSLMTQNGALGYTPDVIITMRPEDIIYDC